MAPAVFQHITLPGNPQLSRVDADPAFDQKVSPAFLILPVMGPLMHQCAVHCAVILLPLIFNVDQCPLPAAKHKMLQAGKLEEVVLGIDHPMRIQVTPAGSFSSSTLT